MQAPSNAMERWLYKSSMYSFLGQLQLLAYDYFNMTKLDLIMYEYKCPISISTHGNGDTATPAYGVTTLLSQPYAVSDTRETWKSKHRLRDIERNHSQRQITTALPRTVCCQGKTAQTQVRTRNNGETNVDYATVRTTQNDNAQYGISQIGNLHSPTLLRNLKHTINLLIE